MAHVGLNGLSNRRVDDDEDFEFGALPDDESEVGRTGEEIDAVNDETFGCDLAAGAIDDLEEYSKQTAGLGLEEGTSTGVWPNEPTCSVSAPDASQLPIPPFHGNHVSFDESAFRLASSYTERPSAVLTPFQLNLGTVDSLWKTGGDSGTVWGAPDIISKINRSAFDFIHSKSDSSSAANNDASTDQRIAAVAAQSSSQEAATLETPKKSKLAPIPKGALTLEEIESEQLRSAARCSSVPVPTIPPIPSEGALTLEDFEKQLLLESSNVARKENRVAEAESIGIPGRLPSGVAHLAASAPTHDESEARTALSASVNALSIGTSKATGGAPGFPAFPFPMLPPFVMHAVRAHLMGQLPELPPGVPPIPPQLRAALLASSMGPPPPPPPMMPGRMPPPMAGMGTGNPMHFRPMARPPFVRPGQLHPLLPPHLLYQQQHQMARFAHQCFREQQMKRAGLPSGKTISDFAFDPYAGFMSRKECEWLIKIQALQCQGSGVPYEDDFYYTSWKQRRIAAERRAQGLKPEITDVDVPTTTTSAHHYVPPTFAGSLGKPTLSSANNPRQLIDVNVESVEEEERNNAKGSTQKRLRALLMQLEGVATLVIECDDRRRQLQGATLSDELHAQLRDEICTRVDTVIECLCAPSRLPSVMVVRKGRQFYARALLLANKAQQQTMLTSLFSLFPAVLRKAPADELSASLLSSLVNVFGRLSKEALISVVQSLSFDASAWNAFSCNPFALNVAMSLLVCGVRKRVNMVSECARSSLCNWLASRGAAARVLSEYSQWKPLEQLTVAGFTREEVLNLESSIAKLFGGRPDSVASALRKHLRVDSSVTPSAPADVTTSS